MVVFTPVFDLQDKLVQHDFAERVGGALAARYYPHGRVAITTQGCLHDGKIERNRANLKFLIGDYHTAILWEVCRFSQLLFLTTTKRASQPGFKAA